MALTGTQHQQIQSVLLDAFDEQGLRELVKFELGQDLEVIASGNRGERTYELVAWTDRRGQLRTLIDAACRANPGNAGLQLLHANMTTWMTVESPPEPGIAPYKGMSYFDVGDADRFFGRRVLTEELVCLLRVDRLLVIVGASGSGKSSLARAGIIPLLQRGEHIAGSERWQYRLLTPTAHPLTALAACLASRGQALAVQSALIADLRTDARSLGYQTARLLANSPAPHLVLLVDQFEEVFTLCREREERIAFLDNLLAAAQPDGQITIVVTLRADFYAACADHDEFRRALEQHQKYIGAMTREELRQTIEEPAFLDGWDFEGGLVEEMLRDAGAPGLGMRPEPSALPLLSHALLETWKRRNGRTMTFAGYAGAGGVSGAIATTAESVYSKQLTEEEQRVARRIFLRLVLPGEGTLDTRRRAKLEELYPRQPASVTLPPAQALQSGNGRDATTVVLDKLASARLITTDSDDVEIVHEALIREWPTLRE